MDTAQRRVALLKQQLEPELTHGSCPGKMNNRCPVGGYELNKIFPRLLEESPIRVCITGAAGNIAYSLAFKVAAGEMFGARQKISLRLLDIPPMAEVLKGVEMELEDCAFPLVSEIIATTDLKLALMHADVVILVGAFPRKAGMERKELLKKNATIFQEQGKAINDFASRNVKVLVVGNPANTNALLAMTNAPGISPQNFSALTRLDHNRAAAQIASKLKVSVESVRNVIIWGNHSATQVPDADHSYVTDFPSPKMTCPVTAAVNDREWLENEFMTTVQQRGAAIIKSRKLSSAASAAHAIVCHMRDWLLGTPEGQIVSMGVLSDGSYGVPRGIIYSFPVTCSRGEWHIVPSLALSDFTRSKMDITAKELLEEKEEALSFLS